ncbi:MAG: type II toxin-antitoxin system VapB family antitoxin [Solirubrobacteraceae bacterium]
MPPDRETTIAKATPASAGANQRIRRNAPSVNQPPCPQLSLPTGLPPRNSPSVHGRAGAASGCQGGLDSRRRSRATDSRPALPVRASRSIHGSAVARSPRPLAGVRSIRCEVYAVDVARTSIKRTNINLDRDLVDAAAEILGTARTTDTVHAALRAVIARASRERLAERDFADLTPSQLDRLRAPRHAA